MPGTSRSIPLVSWSISHCVTLQRTAPPLPTTSLWLNAMARAMECAVHEGARSKALDERFCRNGALRVGRGKTQGLAPSELMRSRTTGLQVTMVANIKPAAQRFRDRRVTHPESAKARHRPGGPRQRVQALISDAKVNQLHPKGTPKIRRLTC
jgi:hypothetical protein